MTSKTKANDQISLKELVSFHFIRLVVNEFIQNYILKENIFTFKNLNFQKIKSLKNSRNIT